METVPTFYEDFYRTELEVWVDALVSHERFGNALVLSETLCHPHGGGQKGDRGALVLPGEVAARLGGAAALPIVDTRRDGGRILHLAGEGLDEAAMEAAEEALVGTQPFTLRLDWDFRFAQMRLHSAAHLLHCFVERVLERPVDYPETSDLQPDFGLNRYERKELLDEGQLARVLEQLNAYIAGGHPIATRPDPEKSGFRYWECGDWVIPCGGTHPAGTAEIGRVEASLSLKRGRTSITFKVAGA